jgi:hypothetical protein
VTELKVVRGDATAEEIAAVVAVLVAASSGVPEETAPEARSPWAAPRLRTGLPVPGPGAWTLSLR